MKLSYLMRDRLADQATPITEILTSFSMIRCAQQALQQCRCAILRYAKLRDEEILKRLLETGGMEKVCH